MTVQVCMPDADALVGRFVLWQSAVAGGKQCLGFFCATLEEDKSGGWVYDFATKEHVQAPASHCIALPEIRLCGRFKGMGVRVKVPKFGEGEIIEDSYDFRNKLQVRVAFGEGRKRHSVLIRFSLVKVVVPPPPRT